MRADQIRAAFAQAGVRAVNPPHDDVPFPEGEEDYGLPIDAQPELEPPPALIKATPFAVRDPATLPARDILYGRHLVRGFVAGLVGISGGGKSTLTMAENFARVSGKPLLGVDVRTPLRCWSINLEDPRDEIERRAQAICLHYGLTEQDIDGRLFLDSGRDQPVVVARTLAGGTKIMEPVVDNIIAEIIARKIDVLTIDPFVSSHESMGRGSRARRVRC
jgi:AAA domain